MVATKEQTKPAEAAGNGHEPDGPVELETKRRMPDKFRRFMIVTGKDPKTGRSKWYLPAAYRLVWFRDDLGDQWGIRTKLIEGGHEAGFACVHAEILNPEGRVIASDLKTETKQDFPAGWVEKACTGAVARALAQLGFGTQFMPELDDFGGRVVDAPQDASGAAGHVGNGHANGAGTVLPKGTIWPGPGPCKRCNAPEGKPHFKPCI